MNEFVIEKDGKLSEKILNFYNGAVTYSLAMKTIRKKDVKVNGARVNKDCSVKKRRFNYRLSEYERQPRRQGNF